MGVMGGQNMGIHRGIHREGFNRGVGEASGRAEEWGGFIGGFKGIGAYKSASLDCDWSRTGRWSRDVNLEP